MPMMAFVTGAVHTQSLREQPRERRSAAPWPAVPAASVPWPDGAFARPCGPCPAAVAP
jgi:hypothetical protein